MSNLRAQRSLLDLAQNIKQARLARRWARADLAERAGVSVKTLQRLEQGDGGVGIGNLAAVLAAMGESDALARLLRIEDDAVGLSRALEALPKRGKTYRKLRRAGDAEEVRDTDDDEGVGF